MRKYLTLLAAGFVVLLATQAHAQAIQRLSAQYLRFDGSESASATAATGFSPAVPGTGGVRVYSKAVFVPFSSGPQTLYVTLSAIGDDHGGQPNFMSCNVDAPGGVPSVASQVCNPTPTTGGIDLAPPGWLTLAHHFDYDISEYVDSGVIHTGCGPASCGDGGGGLGDEHDNDYYYTWCKPIATGTHTINIRMGNKTGTTPSSFGEDTTVFFEKAFVFVDVSPAPPFGGCNAAVIPSS
jgi:hypothetical protein